MKKYDVISVVTKGPFTEVRDARGQPVQNWYGINIAARPGKKPVIQVNMVAGAFNIEGVPTFMVADPAGGPPKAVKSIEFYDGTGLKFPFPPPTGVIMQPPPSARSPMSDTEIPANNANLAPADAPSVTPRPDAIKSVGPELEQAFKDQIARDAARAERLQATAADVDTWRTDLKCVRNDLGDCIAKIPQACVCKNMPKMVYEAARNSLMGAPSKPNGDAA